MKKVKQYSSNKTLYIPLLLIAIVMTLSFLLIDYSSKCFTITSGIGCGGIASVIVAWLIDVANCRQQNKQNDDFLEHVFDNFDMYVKNELQTIISYCAKYDNDINLEKKYSIEQILEMINNANGMSPFWDICYNNLGVAYESVNTVSLLAFDPTPQHTMLYSLINMCASNSRKMKSIMSCYKIEDNSESTFPYIMICSDMKLIENIYSIRSMKVELELNQQSKEFIREFRNAKKRGDVSNASGKQHP